MNPVRSCSGLDIGAQLARAVAIHRGAAAGISVTFPAELGARSGADFDFDAELPWETEDPIQTLQALVTTAPARAVARAGRIGIRIDAMTALRGPATRLPWFAGNTPTQFAGSTAGRGSARRDRAAAASILLGAPRAGLAARTGAAVGEPARGSATFSGISARPDDGFAADSTSGAEFTAAVRTAGIRRPGPATSRTRCGAALSASDRGTTRTATSAEELVGGLVLRATHDRDPNQSACQTAAREHHPNLPGAGRNAD